MRRLAIFRNGILAGTLTEVNLTSYSFEYDERYFYDSRKSAISLTLPKTKKTYTSNHLFPFFYNMLSEGVNKQLQNRHLKIDENDHFGLLMEIAQYDTIGPISVKKIAT